MQDMGLQRRRFLHQAGLGTLAFSLSLACSRFEGLANPTTAADLDVVVIGAGIAGLAAARELQNQGFRVLILEGRNRIGGRIWTDRSWGVPMDMGASWIHGPDGGNPITPIANAAQAELFMTDDESVEIYDTEGHPIPAVEFVASEAIYDRLLEQIQAYGEAQAQDLSVASVLERIAPQALQDPLIRYQLTSYMEFDAGGPIELLSAWYWHADKNYPGLDVLLPNGYDSVPNYLATNLKISLNQTVQSVAYDSTGVTITTPAGEVNATAAIVTLPLGVLQAGTVTFDPDLPTRMYQAMGRLKMGMVNKVVLQYPQAFWDEALQYFGYTDPEKGRYSYFLNARTFSPANALITFGLGNYGLKLERQTDDAIVAEIQRTLNQLFGISIPEPEGVLVSRWTADPWAKGSYSYAAVGATPEDFTAMGQTLANRLFFAGEHTIPDYRGTVHGAYLSGIRAATQASQALKQS